MTTFIDWINIAQNHIDGPDLPSICGGYLTREDKDFKHEWTVGSFDRFEGSHDTSVSVRAFSRTVEVRGNVGRIDRFDNLFNHDIDGTKSILNGRILGSLGLPPMTPAPPSWVEDDNRSHLRANSRFYPGATVSLLHVTRNYATGSAKNAQEFINYLATQSVANVKRSRAGATSVAWGKKGGRKMIKGYIKAPEMKAHTKSKLWTPEHQRLYEFCNDVGLVRLEMEMGRKLLEENGMRGLGGITMGKVIQLFDEMVERPLLNPQRFENGYALDKLSRKARLAFLAWEKGVDLLADDFCSRATLYRYAKEVREVLGLSILEKRDFETLPVRYKVIEPKAIEVPEWYKMVA